jgi:23S rRNA (guanosine2251-2'-O)-methyltransferase
MKRNNDNLEWIYGIHSVRAAVKSRLSSVREMVVSSGAKDAQAEFVPVAKKRNIPVRIIASREISDLAYTDSHQGIAVKAGLPPYASLDNVIRRKPYTIVVLDGITDPQNLGAIIRSAEAFGVSGVVVGKDRSARITPAVHKASSGAIEFMPVCMETNISRAIKRIKKEGYWVYGADVDATESLASIEFSEKKVIVIGAEDKGIRPGVKKEVDFPVKIMLFGQTKALNASAASAILIYESTKR